MTARGDVLDAAKAAVDGDRNKNYGEPIDNFTHTAGLLNAMWPGGTVEFDATDVAILMVLVKVSRLFNDPGHRDSWLDIAGYAACGAEVADAS